MPGKSTFAVSFPEGYCPQELLKVLGRDPLSVSEKLVENVYTVAYSVNLRPQLLSLRISDTGVECNLEGDDTALAHETVSRILNLRQDPAGFERLAADLGFGRLFSGREGLRIPLIPTLFEGLLWVVVGQQVNFRFAAALRARVTELVGVRVGEMVCMPEASAVAALAPSDLLALQFSRQKADYLISIAGLVASGDLDLAKLALGSASAAARTLIGVRGLGVWSVNYLMMRALGFADCVPLGDTGIRSGCRKLFGLDHEPKPEECDTLLKPFSPYRSLACYHLWRGF